MNDVHIQCILLGFHTHLGDQHHSFQQRIYVLPRQCTDLHQTSYETYGTSLFATHSLSRHMDERGDNMQQEAQAMNNILFAGLASHSLHILWSY